MHIELEISENLSNHLLLLQKQHKKNLNEMLNLVLTQGIDTLIKQTKEKDKGHVLNIMEKYKLIGCLEEDADLSVNYKQKLWQKQ